MIIEVKEKKLQEVVVDSYLVCDKCSQVIEDVDFHVMDCKITYTRGTCYPGDYDVETDRVDLCEDCAESLIDLLTSNGYRINKH